MRHYEKSNPEKLPYHPSTLKQSAAVDKVAPHSVITNAGKQYRKEDGMRTPYAFLVIISGGEVRERNYFKIISDQKRFRQIKIEFIADPKQLNPDGLLQTAKYKQEHYRTSQGNKPDQIYIVSDVDHFINDLLRIKPECQKHGIQLIISNPCFEIWLYYGRFDVKPTNFSIPADQLKISQSFKSYLNKEVKGGIDPTKAIFDIRKNIQNAKMTYVVAENGIPELFSTNMFILAEELWPLIEDELKKLMAEKEQKIKSYKA
ncbi:MAG: RloB family protein [Bacteroidales bacterium]|jgi:hypothetical protein|nr:RloB family protein [Bacteroidales bacterium]